MMGVVLGVSIAGVVGTLLRFGLSQWIAQYLPRHVFLATLLINLLGCAAIGFLYVWAGRHELSLPIRQALLVGFLGAFTTFSTFSLDALRLFEDGRIALAVGYVALSVSGGLASTWLGVTLARL